LNILRRFPHPINVYGRYLFQLGTYPYTVTVNTPAGKIRLNLYSHHDLLTVNEIFCRLDYRCTPDDKVIVDFGSNIGISATYFLTSSPQAYCYLFEPLPSNIDRLRRNLAPFEDRLSLSEIAVGLENGTVEFGWEESGRYGGVGLKTGNYISVPCVDSNQILHEILQQHKQIDILKVDIETLEEAVTSRISLDLARRIKKIYVEYKFQSNPLEKTHSFRQFGTVAQFTSKDLR
jgi:FkbM family methyltransferase